MAACSMGGARCNRAGARRRIPAGYGENGGAGRRGARALRDPRQSLAKPPQRVRASCSAGHGPAGLSVRLRRESRARMMGDAGMTRAASVAATTAGRVLRIRNTGRLPPARAPTSWCSIQSVDASTINAAFTGCAEGRPGSQCPPPTPEFDTLSLSRTKPRDLCVP